MLASGTAQMRPEVRGIELDAPHILTHPAPSGELAERMRQLIEGAGLMDA